MRAHLQAVAINTLKRLWLRTVSRPVAWAYHRDVVYRTDNFGSTDWLGTPIWQNVLDLWTIQESIAEIKPALLIETGTFRGGSARFYAQLMDLLDHGRVVTVDVVNHHEGVEHPRIEFLDGSSTDTAIVQHVREAAEQADGPVMVILDGNHDCDHVRQELELYAPLVSPGSLLLSQDGIIDQMWIFSAGRPGPLSANRAFLEEHDEFEYDRERNERYGLTHHPVGWMRRLPGRPA
jgi:cephalosporin hydroxylase